MTAVLGWPSSPVLPLLLEVEAFAAGAAAAALQQGKERNDEYNVGNNKNK